ncbi:MAG: hypothetical protein E6936_12275 [Clostridium perfringens]|nr:hypothetical protein [Clostridium perfringens]MDM0664235.1 hypothetical protein [Clostridium perfringens]MDU1308222.1 hypothetical protein [Clostridium perfringens]
MNLHLNSKYVKIISKEIRGVLLWVSKIAFNITIVGEKYGKEKRQ